MITISEGLAPVLVTALRDCFDYRCRILDACEVGDVTDVQEFLVKLGLLEGHVREQYEALEKSNPQMIPYRALFPEASHPSSSEKPTLTLVE